MARTDETGYKVRVAFKRTFSAPSCLEGITIDDAIHHVDLERAQEWIEGVQGRAIKGCTIHSAHIVQSEGLLSGKTNKAFAKRWAGLGGKN